jgi:hypothetical protein
VVWWWLWWSDHEARAGRFRAAGAVVPVLACTNCTLQFGIRKAKRACPTCYCILRLCRSVFGVAHLYFLICVWRLESRTFTSWLCLEKMKILWIESLWLKDTTYQDELLTLTSFCLFAGQPKWTLLTSWMRGKSSI